LRYNCAKAAEVWCWERESLTLLRVYKNLLGE
jgi:hypothetical protein